MGTHWLPSEDLQMCISFVRHNVDEYNGNKQKRDKLWETIHADFVQNWEPKAGENPTNPPRTQVALASHYNKFKQLLQKWRECLHNARMRITSSTSHMDEIKQAQSFYYAGKKKPFTQFECYEVIKDHPSFVMVLPSTPSPYANFMHENNFEATPPTESSPFVNLDDDTPHSNISASSSPVRPMGCKAAKEARRLKKQGKNHIEQRDEVLHTIASDQAKWHSERKKHNEKELEYYKEYIEIQKKKETRAEKEYQLKKQVEEREIMTMDMEALTLISKKYYMKRKLQIHNEGEPKEDEATNETFFDCYQPRILFP